MQIDAPVFDFGTALNGVAVKHVFHLKNVGTAPLIIGGVQTSCGCTAAQPTKSTVAPGDESDIAVTFDTRSDKGPASRTITVLTNDPKHQQLNLTLKGDVKVAGRGGSVAGRLRQRQARNRAIAAGNYYRH